MDDIDRKILNAVQDSGDLSVAEIAEKAGLSHTPCWKRLKRLRESGILLGSVGLVDRKQIGLNLVGFVLIRATHHSRDWVAKFLDKVSTIPEIVECHRMTGEIDYLLKVVTSSMEGYDEIYMKLVDLGGMRDISVSFSMEQMKQTTKLPLHHSA